MFALQKSKRKAPARNQIAIESVQHGIVFLPGREYRAVLQVSSLNFELKSEAEQDAIIDTYESFLNSLGMSLQILIRTREIDMDKYLTDLRLRLDNETEPVYRLQIEYYDSFIRSLISSNKILSRHFYIVVPFQAAAETEFDLVREQLSLKIDIVIKGMARLGMRAQQLDSLQTLDLFYNFYSPTQAKLQPLTDRALNMVHTLLIEKGCIDA